MIYLLLNKIDPSCYSTVLLVNEINVESYFNSILKNYGISFSDLGFTFKFVISPSIFSAIFIYILSRFRGFLRNYSALEYFIGNNTNITVVNSSIYNVKFEAENLGTEILMPPITGFTPVGDIMGYIRIKDFLNSRVYGMHSLKKYRITAQFIRSKDGSDGTNFISIGGHSVNSVTRKIIEQRKIPDLLFSLNCGVLDKRSYITERHEGNPEGMIIVDYGYILNLSVIPKGGQRVLILFGNWPQGTEAACKAVIGEVSNKDQYKALRKTFRRKSDTITIVENRTSELSDDCIRIVRIKELKH